MIRTLIAVCILLLLGVTISGYVTGEARILVGPVAAALVFVLARVSERAGEGTLASLKGKIRPGLTYQVIASDRISEFSGWGRNNGTSSAVLLWEMNGQDSRHLLVEIRGRVPSGYFRLSGSDLIPVNPPEAKAAA